MAGRKAGSRNYKKRVLLNVIRSVKPIGGNGWRSVAKEYQRQTNEPDLRESRVVKRYFLDTMCENFREVTGKSDGIAAESQELALELERMCAAAGYGARDDARNNDPDRDYEDEEEEEDEYDEADEEDSRGQYDAGPRVGIVDDDDDEDESDYEDNNPLRHTQPRGGESSNSRAVAAPAHGTVSFAPAAATTRVVSLPTPWFLRPAYSPSGPSAAPSAAPSASLSAAPNATESSTSRKRPASSDDSSGKTKNSRPTHPRGGAAQAINNLATTLGQHASGSSNSNAELIQAMLTANQQNMQAMVQLSASNNMQMLQVILGMNGNAPALSVPSVVPTSPVPVAPSTAPASTPASVVPVIPERGPTTAADPERR